MIPRFSLLIALGVLAIVFIADSGPAMFATGMIVGAILRQLSILYQASKAVPVLFEVIDWEKVDRILQEDAESEHMIKPL